MAGNSMLDNVLADLRGDVKVTYSSLGDALDKQVLTEGVVRKMCAIYAEMKKQGGRIEGYALPLRREGEYVTRDVFVPRHSVARGAFVEVDADAFMEYDPEKYKKMLVDGWMHFHPEFYEAGPSSTDRGNNEVVVSQLFNNRIVADKETVMSNVGYEIQGDKIFFSDMLTGFRYSLPIAEIKKMLGGFSASDEDGSGISEERLESFVRDYFGKSGAGFKIMSTHQKREIMYAKSTIFTGVGLDELLKLDGTTNGGYSRNIYSEVFYQEYIGGKMMGGVSAPKRIPVQVIKVPDDIIIDPREIEDIVRYKIIEPITMPKPVPVAKPAEQPPELKKEEAAAEPAVPAAEVPNVVVMPRTRLRFIDILRLIFNGGNLAKIERQDKKISKRLEELSKDESPKIQKED